MATFAEYPTQTMSSNEDFPLYSYPDVWNNDQTYLPTSTYHDGSYMSSTTFDSFQTQLSYAQPEQYSFGTDQSFLPKHNLQPASPHYSDAHSASNSFDLQPPVLSSTSDSGASVHSTISSAMGSPSAHPRSSNDWTQQHGMDMLPSIVQHDQIGQNLFATTAFDFETIPVTDKGCVGEFSAISSSHYHGDATSFNSSMNRSSYDLLRDVTPRPQSYGSDQWFVSNVTPPMSSGPELSVVSNLAPHYDARLESTSPNDSVFKSPTTPASATSPLIERVRGKRKASVAPPTPKRARAASPLVHSLSYTESDLPSRPQAPPPTLSSPFFTQSSGNFVPPLELSCPSPSLYLVFLMTWSHFG